MSQFFKLFSLREILGNLAPGIAVLYAIDYMFNKIFNTFGLNWEIWNKINSAKENYLIVFFVIAYVIGMLLTSLTQTAYQAVIRSRAIPQFIFSNDTSRANNRKRTLSIIDWFAHHFISYLKDENVVTTSVQDFRQKWSEKVLREKVLSIHALQLAVTHYVDLFEAEPEGEESLLFCELFVRERMPSAMQEIEQNASKAALMGNLMIPIFFWLFAIGVLITLPIIQIFWKILNSQGDLRNSLGLTILYASLFVVVFKLILPFLLRLISQLWIEASKNYVRASIILIAIIFPILQIIGNILVDDFKWHANLGENTFHVIFFIASVKWILPFVLRMIGQQWIDASRDYVRNVILSFVLACRIPQSRHGNSTESFNGASLNRSKYRSINQTVA